MSKIIEASVSGVRKIKHEQIIKPESDIVIICGKNKQGKTSFIDAIASVFEGGASLPAMPLNNESKKGVIRVTLSNGLVYTRTITEKGSTLAITDETGRSVASPATYAAEKIKLISFNPLEFAQGDNTSRLKTAKKLLSMLVGSDLSSISQYLYKYEVKIADDWSLLDALDALVNDRNGEVYLARRDYRKNVKALIDAMPPNSSEKFNLDELEEELEILSSTVKVQEGQRDNFTTMIGGDRFTVGSSLSFGSTIDEFYSIAEKLSSNDQDFSSKFFSKIGSSVEFIKEMNSEIHYIVSEKIQALTKSITPLNESIKVIEGKIAIAKEKAKDELIREEQLLKLKEAEKRVADCEADFDRLLEIRKETFSKVSSSVEGFRIENETIFVGEIPFEQLSQAERLELSVKIAISLSPELRVMRITDGNSLDKEAFERLQAIIEGSDFQLWIELVHEEDVTGITYRFHDGEIV